MFNPMWYPYWIDRNQGSLIPQGIPCILSQTMSRPAAAAAAASGRKAGAPPDDERPSKFLATTDAKGELLKTIVQKQAEISKMNQDVMEMIAQFMTLSSSVSYMGGEERRQASDLDNLLVANKDLQTQMTPLRKGTGPYQENIRLENSSGMYLHAMTWMHELVKSNRGRWMGEVNGKKVSGPIIVDRYVRHSAVEFPLIQHIARDPVKRKLRRDPANNAWGAVFGRENKAAEFLSELTRMGASRYFLMSFKDPKTLLDLVEDMMGVQLDHGQRSLCPFTLAAINIYGGVQLWTAILWCLVVYKMDGFSDNNGLWAAQLLDKGEGPTGRVTARQLDTAGALISQNPANWPSWARSDPSGFGENALWPLTYALEKIEALPEPDDADVEEF